MLRLFILVTILILPLRAMAEVPVDEEVFIVSIELCDGNLGAGRGSCIYMVGTESDREYRAFVQNDTLMYIEERLPTGEVVTIWESPTFNTY
jgi:hypothetical protein